jgi:hypothetical protein
MNVLELSKKLVQEYAMCLLGSPAHIAATRLQHDIQIFDRQQKKRVSIRRYDKKQETFYR